MKKSATRFMCIIFTLACMISLLSVTAFADQVSVEKVPAIEARYSGVSSIDAYLSISSSGRATCETVVTPRAGYSVDVTMCLERNGIAYATWTTSGSSTTLMTRYADVPSGHVYQVVVTVLVKTSGGRLYSTETGHSYIVAH